MALTAIVLIGGEWPAWEDFGSVPGLPQVGGLTVFLLVLVVNGFGEEVGWRGVAWPLVRSENGLARSALYLSVLWVLWHLPTFWIDSGMTGFEPLMTAGWLVSLPAGAVVLRRLMERADGSLLIPAIFHGSLNMAAAT